MFLLLAFLPLVAYFASVNATPTIQLGKTTLVGRDIASLQQEFFGGISYAEPPLANLRLRPPVLKSCIDSHTFNATDYGPACLQVKTGLPLDQMSEDCLTINVLRPSGISADAKLPVSYYYNAVRSIIQIRYGGGFDAGYSRLYNGSGIVAQSVARGTPVIYVNFNYRVGPLGFPQGQEADDKRSLNLGLKDQLAALEWVQLHIQAFGGDRTKVTVFGQSAGSGMTSILFLSSPIHNLARAAIFQSGFPATAALFTAARRESTWQTFVGGVASCASTATSGSTFGCLAHANTTEIFAGLALASAEATEFSPGLIPDLPSILFKRGQFARLPFIAGTNGLYSSNNKLDRRNPRARRRDGVSSSSPTTLENSAMTLLQLYPDIPALGSPYNTGNNTFGLSSQFKRTAALGTLLYFRRLWMDTAANAGFTQPQPASVPPMYGGASLPCLGNPYVYGAPSDTSPSAVLISRIMTDYWVSFATSLTPNDGPEWTQFTPDNKVLIQLNGANLTMILDDYRAGINLSTNRFINSDPAIWRH
ncbi:esterase 1 [Mycena leptocephala]|nr:esterase 1 [Mycena leptocephala]